MRTILGYLALTQHKCNTILGYLPLIRQKRVPNWVNLVISHYRYRRRPPPKTRPELGKLGDFPL